MILDLYLVYSFIKRLTSPFTSWKAYDSGIIDADGNILKKKYDRTPEDRKTFGLFDLLTLKLKRLLAKLPGGTTKIATYAAALWLIKEHKHFSSESTLTEDISEYTIDESLKVYLESYFYYTTTEENVNMLEDIVSVSGIAGLTEPTTKVIQKKLLKRRMIEGEREDDLISSEPNADKSHHPEIRRNKKQTIKTVRLA